MGKPRHHLRPSISEQYSILSTVREAKDRSKLLSSGKLYALKSGSEPGGD